jgi:hypothetical protein
MAFKVIPVRSDIAAYRFVITLDGVIYRFTYKFNSRMNLWLMDIADSEANDIVVGRPIFSNVDPFRIFVQEALPPGQFIPLNLERDFIDATEENFGTQVKLFYQEAAT